MHQTFYFRRAKVIDYWVIGIDEENTDNSPEVIMKHVGHIPGKIVTVSSPVLPESGPIVLPLLSRFTSMEWVPRGRS